MTFKIRLESIPISPILLNQNDAPVRLPILPPEPPPHEPDEQDEQELRGNSTPHARPICRILTLHEGTRGVDAPDGGEEHLDAAGYGATRGAADIVGLEGNDGREIAVATADTEKDT